MVVQRPRALGTGWASGAGGAEWPGGAGRQASVSEARLRGCATAGPRRQRERKATAVSYRREGSGNARHMRCLSREGSAVLRGCVQQLRGGGVVRGGVALLGSLPRGGRRDHAARCGEGAPERDQVPTLRVAAGESSVILPHPPLPVVGVSTGGEEGVSAKMTVSPWLPAGRTRTESRARRRSRCSAPSRRREFCHSAAPHLSLSWAF